MDQNVKRMLKLIEEDAESFAKKAEMYYRKRPELISLVEEFYRMYRSLAERYVLVTGELRKSIHSDLQSQGSGVSDIGSEQFPSPDRKPSRRKSGPRAAGFEFFLGTGGSGSDLGNKEGEAGDSSTSDSESGSDVSSVNNYMGTQSNDEEQELRRKITELEVELRDVKEKLKMQQKEVSDSSCKHSNDENSEALAKIAAYEEDLRITKEKIQLTVEENSRLMTELQKYKSHEDAKVLESGVEVKPNQVRALQESADGSKSEVSEPMLKIQMLKEKLRIMQEKLQESEKEVASLRQDQLNSVKKEVSVWKTRLEKEKSEVLKLQEQVERYKTNLADRDQEIISLKEAVSNANKSLSDENSHLQAEIAIMVKERAYLENNLTELNLLCQSGKLETEVKLQAEIELLNAEISEKKAHNEELDKKVDSLKQNSDVLTIENDNLNVKIATLAAEMSSKGSQMDQMNKHLHQLHMQHVELIVEAESARKQAEKLRSRVMELEREVERREEVIREAAEEK